MHILGTDRSGICTFLALCIIAAKANKQSKGEEGQVNKKISCGCGGESHGGFLHTVLRSVPAATASSYFCSQYLRCASSASPQVLMYQWLWCVSSEEDDFVRGQFNVVLVYFPPVDDWLWDSSAVASFERFFGVSSSFLCDFWLKKYWLQSKVVPDACGMRSCNVPCDYSGTLYRCNISGVVVLVNVDWPTRPSE